MPSDRDDLFGNRVRAARAYKGLSQAQLADAISQRYPEAAVSPSTIKRLEANDAAVRGSKREWTVWIADMTGAPDWFLEHGWTRPRPEYGGNAFEASWLAVQLGDLRDSPDSDELTDQLAEGLAKFGIQFADDDSFDDVIGRLDKKSESLSRLAEAHAGREQEASYERWLIRKGFSEQARKELLGAAPETMKELAEKAPALTAGLEPGTIRVPSVVQAPRTQALVEGLMNPDAQRELREFGDAIQQELDRRDPQEVRRALAKAKAPRPDPGEVPKVELSEADATLVARVIKGGERLSGGIIAGCKRS